MKIRVVQPRLGLARLGRRCRWNSLTKYHSVGKGRSVVVHRRALPLVRIADLCGNILPASRCDHSFTLVINLPQPSSFLGALDWLYIKNSCRARVKKIEVALMKDKLRK